MGYFNYFIKFIIRKFVNLLFKPKMFLALLIIIGLLFAMQISSRAEWTDDEIQRVIEDLESIAGTNIYIYQELEDISTFNEWMSADLVLLRNTLYEVNTKIDSLNTSVANIESELSSIVSQLQSVNTSISNIYNKLEENHDELIEKLDENQQELLTELEKDNQAILEELNMIRDSINGSEEEPTTFTDLGEIRPSGDSNVYRLRGIKLDYETKYTYTIKLYVTNLYAGAMDISCFYSDNLIPSGFNVDDYKNEFKKIGSVPAGSENYIINYQVPSSNPTYIYFTWGYRIEKIEVYRSIMGIVESLNQSNDLQQQQNQLQQQQNQLQQEQNDFLSKPSEDSDVSVDSFNNVDSNDITSSGLTGVFNNIYSSIVSWNSKNISLPIPNTNKSIVIPANYTESMLSSSGGGWIITFIHTVYYFIVGRFMIYSITNIINQIKSGSILNTDSKNNITTDML